MRPPLSFGVVAVIGALALLIPASVASANIGMSSTLSMPSAVVPGQQNLPGSFTVRNTNTPPNNAESNTVIQMKLAPSCGSVSNPTDLCPFPDTGVFSVDSTATGDAATGCAGDTFAVSAPDAQGIVTFTRVGGPLVLPPPGSANTCQVNFTFDVLKMPAIDTNPGLGGVQTRANFLGSEQGNVSGLIVNSRPSLEFTVNRAAATLTTTASDGVVGQPISDTATLTSTVPGGATGTVTFTLYDPSDATCTAAPIFTSANRPITGGSATSADYVPASPGLYRWKASYSGDANHVPLNAPCNAANETSNVVAAAPARSPQSDGSLRGDFNGDGIGDLAVGAPGEDLAAIADAGVVHVIYGSASGLTSTGSQLWSQDSTGIADSAEAGDGFGSTLTAGDFNGDGRDDLAIGAAAENIGAVADAGVVHVLYGSASGLTATGSQLWSQDSSGIADSAEAGDRFGAALATGRLNTGTFAELVVGVPGESAGATAGVGIVHVISGSGSGLTATGSQVWGQDTSGIADSAEASDGFGSSLATGDFNGSGIDDLAVGVPEENIGAIVDAGVVHVLYGTASGLSATGSQFWSQDSAGIADSAESSLTGDRFGSALATGLLNSDAFAELIVGAPSESTASLAAVGIVHVIPGSASGLTATGSQVWGQDTSGVGDSAEANDGFGITLSTGDFNANGTDDLAIGVPEENVGAVADAGGVQVLYGSPSGLTTTGSQFWTQNSAGITDSAEANDLFGAALATGTLDSGAFAELIVGVPDESAGAATGSGVVQVIPGSAGGLTATGSQIWGQASAGIADDAETGDGFGGSLAA